MSKAQGKFDFTPSPL